MKYKTNEWSCYGIIQSGYAKNPCCYGTGKIAAMFNASTALFIVSLYLFTERNEDVIEQFCQKNFLKTKFLFKSLVQLIRIMIILLNYILF